ncbi:outer membrane beta-barrel protein [Alcanivorax sediminis]|uniref:Outer membrane beta-barrel protein n=1 Tax=Alcanivorax sediminis TaxID=2663008 RepID=A0A6N7LQQ6_9GAMM|nr:outer membrane beta-barrel protein [Alcanivorax sediminis]MQX52647.1 outer membrane beta-barrel protein [Alcanivorax sediminis]
MFKKALLVSGVALAVSAPAMAEQRTSSVRDNGFSYNYAQLAYDQWDWDNDIEVDALTAEGAFALDEHLFIRGGLSFFDGDLGRGDLDGKQIYAGVGFHTPLQAKLDFVGSADIIYDDREYDATFCNAFVCTSTSADDDEIGFDLRAGVRAAVADQVELEGGLSYYDVYDDDITLYAQGLFKATDAIDIGARLLFGGDRESIGIFGRYNF